MCGRMETHCLAGAGGFELTNVVAEYPFEVSHEFQSFQRNLGTRDFSGASWKQRPYIDVTVWE